MARKLPLDLVTLHGWMSSQEAASPISTHRTPAVWIMGICTPSPGHRMADFSMPEEHIACREHVPFVSGVTGAAANTPASRQQTIPSYTSFPSTMVALFLVRQIRLLGFLMPIITEPSI